MVSFLKSLYSALSPSLLLQILLITLCKVGCKWVRVLSKDLRVVTGIDCYLNEYKLVLKLFKSSLCQINTSSISSCSSVCMCGLLSMYRIAHVMVIAVLSDPAVKRSIIVVKTFSSTKLLIIIHIFEYKIAGIKKQKFLLYFRVLSFQKLEDVGFHPNVS